MTTAQLIEAARAAGLRVNPAGQKGAWIIASDRDTLHCHRGWCMLTSATYSPPPSFRPREAARRLGLT